MSLWEEQGITGILVDLNKKEGKINRTLKQKSLLRSSSTAAEKPR